MKLIYLVVLCTLARVHLVAGIVHSIVIKKDKMYLTVGSKRLTTLNMRQSRRKVMIILPAFQSHCLRPEILGDLVCQQASNKQNLILHKT